MKHEKMWECGEKLLIFHAFQINQIASKKIKKEITIKKKFKKANKNRLKEQPKNICFNCFLFTVNASSIVYLQFC